MVSSCNCYGAQLCFVAVICVHLLLIGDHYRVSCLPLSTASRWIIDEADGSRVKLACVNWAGHLEPMLPEGLSNQPVDVITSKVKSMGFNCVRLTWATFMFTDPSYGSTTVAETFASLGLNDSLAGIMKNNPQFVDMSHVEAFQAVVDSLGTKGVMVILDNHLSKPGWCCQPFDGNGFWGDTYFDPDVWAEGLRIVASTFRNSSQVVGMSLRNELRGLRSNTDDWFKYMQVGAEIVNGENPDLLVIHGGLNSDTDLSFLSSQQLNENFSNKQVYELHWYSFTNLAQYTVGNLNDICASITGGVEASGGFLVQPNMSYTGPLFLSEFGIDVSGGSENDNRFIECFFAFAAGGDFDWAYWALQGSYYLRQGQKGYVESYGILNAQWDAPQSRSFLARLQTLQQPLLQDITNGPLNSYQLLFHPMSGLCLSRINNTIGLGPCHDGEKYVGWTMTMEGYLMEIGDNSSSQCLQAVGLNEETIMQECGSNTQWTNNTSKTSLQLQSTLMGSSSTNVCLNGLPNTNGGGAVVTRPCKCTYSDLLCLGQQSDDPSDQWFKLITLSSR